ncbi:MAG TPA: MgtC/SapB family protein [Devosia sp.]|nr:MgtC/SapB family protein [Devosia sp.]
MFARGQVHGLTTGAGMWLAGVIGLAIGLGFWQIAMVTTVLAVVVLGLLYQFEPKAKSGDKPDHTAPPRRDDGPEV